MFRTTRTCSKEALKKISKPSRPGFASHLHPGDAAPTSIEGCARELHSKKIVKLPFKAPKNWLKDARELAAARLKESEACCAGYYDIELKEKNGNPQVLERKLDHLWRPVMDALLDASLTGWKLHRRGLLVSMHHSKISPWPQEPTSVLAAQRLSSVAKIGNCKSYCVHVLIPLVDIPPSEHEKYGLASWKVTAGSIILADGRAYHKDFAQVAKDSHHEGFPILYMTYVQQRCEPEDDLSSVSTGESSDQAKTMEEWMEKKGFLLPASFVRFAQKKGLALPASSKSQRRFGFLLNQTPKHLAPGLAPKQDAVPSVLPDQTSAFGMAPVRYTVPNMMPDDCLIPGTVSDPGPDLMPDDCLIPGTVSDPGLDLRRGITLE